MNQEIFFKQFALGSHLYREPMPPMRELKRDLGILKKNGFNLVMLQEHWMIDEPLEGQFDFSRNQELIEEAARLDMAVSVTLDCGLAPAWLYEKHPDCRGISRDPGKVFYKTITSLTDEGICGPCFDHPGAAADAQRFITRLVETLGKYENVVAWNPWQEFASGTNTAPGLKGCCCEHTLAAFHAWLEKKYGGPEELNRAWNTRHADWHIIRPGGGAPGQNTLAQDADWGFFINNARIADLMRSRAEAIRRADPLKRPIYAQKSGSAVGSGDEWALSHAQDFQAASCSPARSPFHAWDDGAPLPGHAPERSATLLDEIAGGVALTFDSIRSSSPTGAPVWAVDFQGGPANQFLHIGRTPAPEDIRRWMLSAVACGVTGISFRSARPEITAQEANGYGLLDGSGESSPRLREAARVGAALNRHAELFAGPSWGGAEVGILVDPTNAEVCSSIPLASEHLAYSTRGWHRLLWELGVPVDFVNPADVSEETAQVYKMLILPFPLSLGEDIAQKLGEYVYAGGGLVSEAVPGRLDEHGAAQRGEISPIFSNLFGVRQTGLSVVREPDGGSRWTPQERGWGEFIDAAVLQGDGPLEGYAVPASLYVQTYECQGSQPILKYKGRPAGAFRVGRLGWAWLLGTCVGHSALAYRRPETPAFVRNLLAQCNVQPLHKGQLLVRKRAIPGKRAWFFTNPNPEPLSESIWVGKAQVEDLFGDALDRQGDHVTLTVDGLDVRVLVATEAAPAS